MLNEPAGFALGVWTALLFCAMRDLLETEKARQGVSATKSGNGLQKTSNIVLSGSYTVLAFSLISPLLSLSVGLLPRSAHENRPANQSWLPLARCQPRCLPYLAKIRGLENAVQPSMLLFMISLISRISHCFGLSKEWFRASA